MNAQGKPFFNLKFRLCKFDRTYVAVVVSQTVLWLPNQVGENYLKNCRCKETQNCSSIGIKNLGYPTNTVLIM